jgi:hypothetical protein
MKLLFFCLLASIILCGSARAGEEDNLSIKLVSHETGGADHSRRLAAGNLFGLGLFWDDGNFVADTILMSKICSKEPVDSCSNNSFRANCVRINKNGKSIYKVKSVSSISAAILHDLGYDVFYLTQLQAVTPEGINVGAPGMSQNFHYQTAFSEYLWEEVSDTRIEKKPKTSSTEFDVKLYFDNNGYCQYGGKTDILSERAQIMGTNQGIVLKLLGNTGWSDMTINRRIVGVYLMSEKAKKAAALVNDIEHEMDKLNLDISYKPPVLTELRFAGTE